MGDNKYGLKHILQRHVKNYPTEGAKGDLFPDVSEDEIIDKIFDIINTRQGVDDNNSLRYQKMVEFSDKSSLQIRVIITKEGKIITAYPYTDKK